jgi:hypothetical protein
MKPGPKAIHPTIRFWRKVDRRGHNECWPWLGGLQGKGYGQFYRAKHHPVGAHRFSWELANGRPVPPGLQVMHSCDNPPCVNPLHLRVGTAKDNNLDKTAKGRNPGNRTSRGGPSPKWSPEVVDSMRKQGMGYREIGAVLGVSAATALRTHRRLK